MLLLAACTLLTGCGPQFGTLLYFSGVGQDQKTPAAFTLPAGPIMILVDDDMDLVHPHTACDALVDSLALELKEYKLAEHVTTNEEIARIRRQEAKFDERGAREVGQLAHADTVIWLKVVRFAVEEDLEIAHEPARFAVQVKVINANATKRAEVVLWPKKIEPERVEVVVPPHLIRACKTVNDVHIVMADKMATEICKLFREVKQN